MFFYVIITGQYVVQQKEVTGLVGIESSIVQYLGDKSFAWNLK